MTGGDQPSRLLYELCSLLLEVLRAPHLAPSRPPASAPPLAPSRPPARRRVPTRMSPARFASLLLGASLALILCGSVTFLIGFILMPWVVGLVILFYFVGIVSNLPGLGRAILCPGCGPSSPKEMSGQYLE
ncbi:hypothetical protein B296_00057813 [Ensete ventricosum]|uniref:Uncharacterized protein n=1 Tax=Ensete ventricosum TaxID=4639 RepID=A0A426XKA2_ENSVE|nr:hypothetical protein B296_00057813 [Ensete ventricosum]